MKNLSVFFALALLLLATLACGFVDNIVGSDSDSTPGVETAIPTELTPVAESEDEVTAESEDSPDSESEAAAEEASPEPTPTEAIVEEESESGAESPVEGSEPVGEEVASAGGGWGESGSGAQSACDHPFMPMRTGSTWTYSDGENTLTWTVTEIQGDLNSATAKMQVTIGDVTIDYTWDCMAGEGMASFDFANLGIGPGGVEMTIEQQNTDGVFLLPADQLQPGASWMMTSEGIFTFNQTEGNTEIEVSGDMTNEQQFTVVSANPVTFEDQTVDGVQLEQTTAISMAMNILGSAVDQTFNTSGSYELGRGIGMVSQSYSTDISTDSLDLISYFVP